MKKLLFGFQKYSIRLTSSQLMAKMLKFFLTEFWQNSYFFLDLHGVFGETDPVLCTLPYR